MKNQRGCDKNCAESYGCDDIILACIDDYDNNENDIDIEDNMGPALQLS